MRRPDRRLVVLIATAGLVVVACSSAPRNASSSATSAVTQRSINAAQSLLDRGEPEAALAQAAIAVREDPRSAQARVVRGLALDALGRGVEAGQAFASAVALAPASGPVLNAHGAWLCRVGRIDEALEAFNRAIADTAYRQPTQALANAGSCAAEAGRDMQAELNFRAALSLQPTQAQSLSGMARLEHRRGDPFKARAFLQRREAVGPMSAAELALAIDIETAAGDERAAARYRDQLAALARAIEADEPSSANGSPTQ